MNITGILKRSSIVIVILGILAIILALVFAIKVIPMVIFAYFIPYISKLFEAYGKVNHFLALSIASLYALFMVVCIYKIVFSKTTFTGKVSRFTLLATFMIIVINLPMYFFQSKNTEESKSESKNWDKVNVEKFGRLVPDKDTRFFDPVTQKPLIWYYKDEKGRIEFFGNPGYHPQLSIPLKPADAGIVKTFLGYIEEGRVQEMVIGANPNLPAVKQKIQTENVVITTDKKMEVKKEKKENKKKNVAAVEIKELDSLKNFLCSAQEKPKGETP